MSIGITWYRRGFLPNLKKWYKLFTTDAFTCIALDANISDDEAKETASQVIKLETGQRPTIESLYVYQFDNSSGEKEKRVKYKEHIGLHDEEDPTRYEFGSFDHEEPGSQPLIWAHPNSFGGSDKDSLVIHERDDGLTAESRG